MRRIIAMAGIALSACVTAPPSIDGGAGAPPRPDSYWVAPRPPAPNVAETSGIPAGVATDALQHLALSDIVDLALRHNPVTLISWAQARAAADQFGASRGALYPSVVGAYDVTRSLPVTTSGTAQSGVERTQYGPAVTLSYLVLDFGGRNGSIESARQTAISADFAHNLAVQNTILDAESAAFSYLATLALRNAEQAAIDEAAANLASAEERHRVGLATIADVLQAQTARAQEALNLETLQGQVQITHGTLAVAMGLPAATAFAVPSITAPDSSSVRSIAQSVDSIIDLAVRSRPDLASARADAARAAAQLRVTRSIGLPSIAFTATGGYLGSDLPNFSGRTYTLNFGLSVPLFSGFADQYAVRSAAELVNAANARTQLTRQQIQLQVFTSYYGLQTATERVRTSADLLASAVESEQVARGRYTEGVGSIVDLLIAQSTLASARAQAVGAQWQWRTALAQLAHDAGVLGIHGDPLVTLGNSSGNDR